MDSPILLGFINSNHIGVKFNFFVLAVSHSTEWSSIFRRSSGKGQYVSLLKWQGS